MQSDISRAVLLCFHVCLLRQHEGIRIQPLTEEPVETTGRTRSPCPGDTAQREEVCPEAAAKHSSPTALSPPGQPCQESSVTKTVKDSQGTGASTEDFSASSHLTPCSLRPISALSGIHLDTTQQTHRGTVVLSTESDRM